MFKLFTILTLLTLFNGCGRVGSENDTQSTYNGDFILKTLNSSTYVQNSSYINNGHYETVIRTENRPSHYDTLDTDPFGDKNNYSLIENGNKKEETRLEVAKESQDINSSILLLLDLSGSIKEEVSFIEDLRTTTEDFINRSTKSKIAIYYFNSTANIQPLDSSTQTPTNNYDVLRNALNEKLTVHSTFIQNLSGYTATNLYGAIEQSASVLCTNGICEQNTAINSVVIITDGDDTAERVTYDNMIASLQTEINYYALGIGNTASDILKKISKTNNITFKFFESDKNSAEEDLKIIFNQVLSDNSFYTIKYCPATQIGLLNINIEFNDGNYKAKTINEEIDLNSASDLRCDL